MISDDELVELIGDSRERWDRPVVTASDIAEEVGMSRQGAHRRLSDLEAEGRIRKYKPGRSAVWWVESDAAEKETPPQ